MKRRQMDMSLRDDFGSWKDFLANKLEQAQGEGMGQETISNMAYEVGSYLSKSVEVESDEEAVLKELWNAASNDEQQALANVMVKLVQGKGNTM